MFLRKNLNLKKLSRKGDGGRGEAVLHLGLQQVRRWHQRGTQSLNTNTQTLQRCSSPQCKNNPGVLGRVSSPFLVLGRFDQRDKAKGGILTTPCEAVLHLGLEQVRRWHHRGHPSISYLLLSSLELSDKKVCEP